MHRSGTSLVSRILNLLGVHLGRDEAIAGSGKDNPKGHWEHHPIALLNDDLLVRFGGRWDVPPVFPPDWLQDAEVRGIADKARRIPDDDFGSEPLWGWKDPRTCLTAPFWQDLLGPMRYVLCVRNPRAVIASLERETACSRHTPTGSGSGTSRQASDPRAAQTRMLLFYEDVMVRLAARSRAAGRLHRAAGPGDDPSVRSSVAAFIEQELQHHHSSPEELAEDAQMSFETKVCTWRCAPITAIPGTSDLLAAQAVASAEREDAFHRTHEAIVADRDVQARAIAALRGELE